MAGGSLNRGAAAAMLSTARLRFDHDPALTATSCTTASCRDATDGKPRAMPQVPEHRWRRPRQTRRSRPGRRR